MFCNHPHFWVWENVQFYQKAGRQSKMEFQNFSGNQSTFCKNTVYLFSVVNSVKFQIKRSFLRNDDSLTMSANSDFVTFNIRNSFFDS